MPVPPVLEAEDEELDMLGYAIGYREGLGESRGCDWIAKVLTGKTASYQLDVSETVLSIDITILHILHMAP